MVERVCADLGESCDEVDIDADAASTARYGEEIPVTFVDGRQHDFWRVDETRLRAACARRAEPDPVAEPVRRSTTCASAAVPAHRFVLHVHKLLQ